ncbi:MAG: PQQ-binding-like beta-propeller repeat protein [Verrucomicrobiales bacterium]|nr:PQQ-binding-like beta-propeller repeat protein [Verrucomicrobiales bacterium]
MQSLRTLAGLMLAGFISISTTHAASGIPESLNLKGGFVVHLGCGDGNLTLSLRPNSRFQVHGLDANPANVAKARATAKAAGVYGSVSIDQLRSARLPYIDGMVNLLVAENLGRVPMAEVMRVLAPEGIAYIRSGGEWKATTKPRPKDIDEWTHFLHDAGGNAVAHDKQVGPPRHLQWLGSPRWSRHHDRMASMSALVSAGGRVFYVMDEGSRVSIQLPARWTLVARDAFNGVILWKKPMKKWHSHLWPLKSGPTQLARRLVAMKGRVYITLGVDEPVSVLDAATGELIHELPGSKGAEEIIVEGGQVFVLESPEEWELNSFLPFHNTGDQARIQRDFAWNKKKRDVKAYDSVTGKRIWGHNNKVAPLTMTADEHRVFFHDGEKVVALNRSSGDVAWSAGKSFLPAEVRFNFGPKLVIHDGVVLYAGGDRTMKAIDAKTGKQLWEAPHARGGYQSPEDLLVMRGMVWSAPTTSGRDSGIFTGRDLRTSKVMVEIPPNVDTYWFHHRCYIAKATDNFLMPSRTGIEFIDPETKNWDINHWVRGGCLYGVMPANGLTYAPPHNCACYPEAKLFGFNALASASPSRALGKVIEANRLERGPAFGQATDAVGNGESDWPTYRHDNLRSGFSNNRVSEKLPEKWTTKLEGKLSAVTLAGNKLFVARVNAHEVVALHAETGKELWRFTTGGRVDSPPSIHDGRAYFGSADGWVYCLRASDGALVWRFRAAPEDRRLMAYEQLESVWPVHGSVLIRENQIYFVAGRSNFLDGGMRWFALDALTGKKNIEVVLDDKEPGEEKSLQDRIQILQMPVGLPDILSSDDKYIYMKSQKFDREGQRIDLGPHTGDFAGQGGQQGGDTAHVFCPTGFLDDTWFHRSYWVYGRSFAGGHAGYYQAGRYAPSGRLLVFDKEKIYGFGRKPKYLKWTTILEHQLFAANRVQKAPPPAAQKPKRPAKQAAMVRFGLPKTMDPTGKALTVSAWVNVKKPNGVILARGGPANGFALVLQRGTPAFLVRSEDKLASVSARGKVVNRWVHIAAVLEEDKRMHIFVDGKPVGHGKAPALIASTPVQGLEIGSDDVSPVGTYKSPNALSGMIDNVRIYHRALSDEEVAVLHAGKAPANDPALVLACDFDKGKAQDASGKNHHGELIGAQAVPSRDARSGMALQFKGNANAASSNAAVAYGWTQDLPILVRAMAKAGDTIYVIGPPDLVDEEESFVKLTEGDPKVQKILAQQETALQGKEGAILLAIDVKTGLTKATRKLPSLPVWDSLAVANGKLFYTTQKGEVVCLGE